MSTSKSKIQETMRRSRVYQHSHSLPFNLPSLPNLSERSTRGVDGDGDLAIEDDVLGGFRELREGTVCGGVVDDWEQGGAELCEEAEY